MIRKHACRGPELVCLPISSGSHWNGMARQEKAPTTGFKTSITFIGQYLLKPIPIRKRYPSALSLLSQWQPLSSRHHDIFGPHSLLRAPL